MNFQDMPIDELIALITKANSAYYAGKDIDTDEAVQEPIMSDDDYDRAVLVAKSLLGTDQDIPTAMDVQYGDDLVKHPTRMYSLSVQDPSSPLIRNLGELLVGLPKYDGIAVNIIYRGGTLWKMVLRGNHFEGDSIPLEAILHWNIPFRVPVPDLQVRGEIHIRASEFEEHFSEQFANARNFVAGSVQRMIKSPKEAASIALERKLRVVVFDSPELRGKAETFTEVLAALWEMGFPASHYLVLKNTPEAIEEYLHSVRENNDVDLDGIVLVADSMEKARYLGESNVSPKWSYAVKFNQQAAWTVPTEIEFNVGATGRVIPLLHYKPVTLGGTRPTKATLHSMTALMALSIGSGSKICIRRAGDTIPYIADVDHSERTSVWIRDPFSVPCPGCGGPLDNIGAHWVCSAGWECKGRMRSAVLSQFSKGSLNIKGFGEKTIHQMVDVVNPTSLYDFWKRSGILTGNLLPELEAVLDARKIDTLQKFRFRPTSMMRIVCALCIPNIGKAAKDSAITQALVDNKDAMDLYQLFLQSLKNITDH